MPDLSGPDARLLRHYNLGSQGPIGSCFRVRLLAQFPRIGFRRTSSYSDEETRWA
jgi:hypothetical protein